METSGGGEPTTRSTESADGDAIEREVDRSRIEELRKTNDRLEASLALLVHDLRNQLNVALGRLQLARRTGEDGHFDAATAALERMERILERSFPIVGGDVDFEQLPIADVARSAWRNVETGAASLEFDLEGETIRGDETHLLHLFENLFTNAVEHGSRNAEEGLTVRVGTFEGGFYVEDTGRGLPPDRREDAFETGYSTAEDGTGLGLSIVRTIVESHGWSVRATRGPGGGARFEIRIAE